MDQINHIIANNLKAIRAEKKMSLDALSEATGVSKSMLGQIQRGESSPTVATLWKIATGLHISFTELLEEAHPQPLIVKNDTLAPLYSDNGQMKIYPIFPYTKERGFEVLSIELEAGAISPSLPHEEGTEEVITVYQGNLTLEVADETYLLETGTSIRYLAHRPHCYKNLGHELVRLSMIINYSKLCLKQ